MENIIRKKLFRRIEKNTWELNNATSKPVKYTNLETKEVIYFGFLNLCVKHIEGKWVPFKKQIDKGRPYKKIHFAEFITREEFLEHNKSSD